VLKFGSLTRLAFLDDRPPLSHNSGRENRVRLSVRMKARLIASGVEQSNKEANRIMTDPIDKKTYIDPEVNKFVTEEKG